MLDLRNIIKALRLPFISVTLLAFIFGSLINCSNFNLLNFLLGLFSAIFTHLGANLINDYADSKSGVDWSDKKAYQFFGGSKLIQKGILSEQFYLKLSLLCFFVAFLNVLLLAILLRIPIIIVYYLIIMFLGWSYSHKPFRFSYYQLGEPVVFLLFGPALVMGGYFIQNSNFPDIKSFLLALPFGFLTTAILFANEVPDYAGDVKNNKHNWVGLFGQSKAHFIYLGLVFAAFLIILFNSILGLISKWAMFSFIFLPIVLKAKKILKENFKDKEKLIESSKLTIFLHTLVSTVLIISILK